MEIVDRKEENNIPELSNSQTIDLFKSIVMGKDILETVKTSRGDFKIKFPRAKDLEEIGRRVAVKLNGIPIRCFDANTYSLITEIAHLDVMVVDGPDWYKLAKRDNEKFSWNDIPDDEFISEVYALAYNFRRKIQEQIKSNKKSGNTELDAVPSGNDNNQPGLFDGMSGDTRLNG